jgi:hypothetical protein
MCTQFTTLVESNDFRRILQCEHGTIHLAWDLVTLYLNLNEFERLAGLLERGTRLTEPSKITESSCILSYKKEGYYQLWVRNIAINLTPIDFLILVDMVRVVLRAASDHQAIGLTTPSDGEQPKIFRRTVTASANATFSLN